ncbi:hypothetical protein CesoFtcFv8_021907 [Champsocephalus esox]|uniref:Fibronectin type-III domain-containing protein n=1 Tax=Champsocephalus esox TaxID=159716 RepID=A0AAN8BAE9_9TELE|nr:hypothetical protein CesoFtcFv8_021907 [Champsocephalus esox]
MDGRSPLRMKLLIMFLLVSTNIVCLHGSNTTGVVPVPHCVTDYLYTVTCSLSMAPSGSNVSYWLSFQKRKKEWVCMLTNTDGGYFCSFKRSNPRFNDQEIHKISLCYNQKDGSKSCKDLVDEYKPLDHIKPNAPCCLTVRHNASQHHLTWKSTYEEFADSTDLVDSLKFQLQFYRKGDAKNVSTLPVTILDYSVDDQHFDPDTEYAARVRTSPDQQHYKGEWSDWSPEVYWKTEAAVNDPPPYTFLLGLGKVLISLFVLMLFILIFAWAPVKKWRKGAFIPTPAPYFHTLYNGYQGDFKSWVVTHEHTADVLKAEETLQIDTLTKCEVVEENEECQPQVFHHFREGSIYSNISDPGCDASMLGVPYAVSTLPPGYPAEGDSGCWLERDPPWYCNEYCTLSAFQQGSPVTAEDHGSLKSHTCPTGIIREEAVTEA